MSDIAPVTVNEEEFVQEPSLEIFQSEDNKLALIDYLAREIEETRTNAGRLTRIERNRTIMRQRVAQPESETKDFPWTNASNITPPLSLQVINQITSKLLSSYSSKKPLFSFESTDPRFRKHADAITRHVQMQVEDPASIGLYTKLWDIMYDMVSFGTEFVKVPFTIKRMAFNRKSADTGAVERVNRVIKASPDVIPIKFEDFLTRPEWHDLQTAPWCGVRYYRFGHELRALQAQGFYQNVDVVLSEQSVYDDEKREAMERQGIEATDSSDVENYVYAIYEINVFWDADGDGIAEDIIVHMERESKTILRAEYNDMGMRDYVRIPYVNIPGVLYGMGVGDIVMDSQLELEALHNMRVDNQQLSMQPFVVTSDSTRLGKGQRLTPGQIVKTPNPREDILVNKLPDVSPSIMSAEASVRNDAMTATGVSDIMAGQDVGGYNRIGATGTQFLAGQSNSYLEGISSQTRNAFNTIPMLILLQNVLNSENIDISMMSEGDQILLNEVYSTNVEDIPSRFKFKARLARIEDSKAAKQGEAMNLLQIYMMYGDKIGQLAGFMADPNLQQAPKVLEATQTYYVGLTKLMDRIFEGFDEDTKGDYLPFVQDMELMLRMMDTQRQQEVDSVEQAGAQAEANAGAPRTLRNDDLGGGGGAGNIEGEGGGGSPSSPESTGGEATIGGAPI